MRAFSLLLSATLLAGCAVGPDHRRPAVSIPDAWFALHGAANESSPAELWWHTFNDSELDSLVNRAVHTNMDIRIASARVLEARAASGSAMADFWPQVDAGLGFEKFRQLNVGLASTTRGVHPVSFAYQANGYSATGSLAWELDVFGRIRRNVEATGDDLRAAQEDRRAVGVSVIGDVGRYYTQLRGAQVRLAIAKRNVAIAEDTLLLTRAQARSGQVTDRDVAQASGALEAVRARVPVLGTAVAVATHRLAILLGDPPEALMSELSPERPIPTPPQNISAGIPSELLERRPDILRAEAALAAATARIGVAKAEYFPHFSLTGTAGREAPELHELTLSLSNFFSIGPSLSLPLFTGGRITANVRLQEATAQASAFAYEKTVLTAFEDVENALVALTNDSARRARIAAEGAADETAFRLSNVQYKAGLTDFLTVLDAERQMFDSEDLLAQIDTDITVDVTLLYQSLGGGWSILPT